MPDAGSPEKRIPPGANGRRRSIGVEKASFMKQKLIQVILALWLGVSGWTATAHAQSIQPIYSFSPRSAYPYASLTLTVMNAVGTRTGLR